MRLREFAAGMAAYNRWMNEKIYDAAASLTDAERKQDLGAAFRSIHGTLNHLLLADTAWMERLHGRPVTMQSPDQELYADFEELRRARREMDDRIAAWAEALEEGFSDTPFAFYSVTYGAGRAVPGWVIVAHLFNHQAHHRGQLTALLSRLGADAGITDLPWMPAFDSG